ncbi:hypothetical protein [Campylobacter sp. RM12647]|uniref:hypothetical protein n=1 Tax=Campylobacter sp. RM12647 TaxID=2735737 RepID=UPI001D59F7CD|nr:hypothetical protein [Campylobacter sp. RM12647]
MKKVLISLLVISNLYSYEYTNKVHPFGMYFGTQNHKQHTDIDLADCVINNTRNNDKGRSACFQLYQIFNIDDHFNRTDAEDEQRIIVNWGFNWDYAWAKLDYQNSIVKKFGYFQGNQSSHHTDSRRFRENVFCVNYEDNAAGTNYNPNNYDDFISHQNSKPKKLDSVKNTEITFPMKSYFYDESYIQDVFKEFEVNTTGKIILLASSDNDSIFSYFLSEQLLNNEKNSNAYRFANTYLGYQHGSSTTSDSENAYNDFVRFMKSKGCRLNPDQGFASGIPLTLDENEVGATLTDNAYYTNDECAKYSEQFFLKNNALYSPKEFLKGNAKWGFLNNQYFAQNKSGLSKCYTFNMEYYDGYYFSSNGYYNEKSQWKSNEHKTYDIKALRLRNFVYNNNQALANAKYIQRFSPYIDTTQERSIYSIHKTRDGAIGEKAIYKEIKNSKDCIIKVGPGLFDIRKECKNSKYKQNGIRERAGIMPKDIGNQENISTKIFSLHLRPTSLKEEYKYYKDNMKKYTASPGDLYAHLKNPKYFTSTDIVNWGKNYGDGKFPADTIVGIYKNKPEINANFKFLFYPDANSTKFSLISKDLNPAGSAKVGDKTYPIFNKIPEVHITPFYNGQNLEKRYDYTKTKDGNYIKCCDKDLSKYYVDLRVQISTLAKNGNDYIIKSKQPSVIYYELDLDYANSENLEYFIRELSFKLKEPSLIEITTERIYDNDKRPMFEVDSKNIIKGVSETAAFILTDEEIVQKQHYFGSIWKILNRKPSLGEDLRPSIKDLNDKKAQIANDTYTRMVGDNVYIGFVHAADKTRISFFSNTASVNHDDGRATKVLIYDKDDFRVNPDNQMMGDFIIEFINITPGRHDICYTQKDMQGKLLTPTPICKNFMVRPAEIKINDFVTKAGEGLKKPLPTTLKASVLDTQDRKLSINSNIGIKEAKLKVTNSKGSFYTFDLETSAYNKISQLNPINFKRNNKDYSFDMVIAYPFAGSGIIEFKDNDFVGSDITNKKCENTGFSNTINANGKISCHILIKPINADFTSSSTTNLNNIKTSDGLSDAVLFSDEVVGQSEADLGKCSGINCDFTHSLNIPVNIENKGSSSANSLEYVYKYFPSDIDIDFDLNFLDNNDTQASSRYRIYTNKLSIKNMNITNQKIKMTLSASNTTLNAIFDSKMQNLDNEVNKNLNTLSSVAKKYEASPDDLEFITKIGYTKFQKTNDLAPSKDILNKPDVNEFNLDTTSSITIDKGTPVNFTKNYPFIFAYAMYKDTKADAGKKYKKLLPSDLKLKYINTTGKISELYTSTTTSGHYYLKPIADIINNISFTSDYNSNIKKLTDGSIELELSSDKKTNEYIKDLIRMHSNSEISAKESFSVEYTK